MNVRDTSEYDIALVRRTGLWVVFIQGVLGVFLLMNTLQPLAHGLLAALLVAVLLLCRYGWEKRGWRVVARLLTGVPLVLAALFAVDLVLTLIADGSLTALLETMCIVAGVALSYLAPAALCVSLKEGRYDRVIACIYTTWLTLLALVATFHTQVCYDLVWSWDNDIVRYAWLGCTAVAALLTWMCALLRTPEQKAQAAAAKAAKKAKKAAK